MKSLMCNSFKKQGRMLACLAGGCAALLAMQTVFLPVKTANAFSDNEPYTEDWTSSENLIVSSDSNGGVTFNKTVLDQIAKAGGWEDADKMIADVQNNSGTYDASQFMTNPDTQESITNGIRIALGTYENTDGVTKPLYWTPVYLTSSKKGEAVLDLWLTDIPDDTEDEDSCYFRGYIDGGSLSSDYPANMYSTSMLRSFLNGTQYATGFSLEEYDYENEQFIDPNYLDIFYHGAFVSSYQEVMELMSLIYTGELQVEGDSEVSSEEYKWEMLAELEEALDECRKHVTLCSQEMGASYQSKIWSSFLEQMGYKNNSCKALLTPADLSYQETEKITDYQTLADEIHAYDKQEDGSRIYCLNANDAYGNVDGKFNTLLGVEDENGNIESDYTNYYKDKDRYNDWKNDYLWIPSITETGIVDYPDKDVNMGIWNLSYSELLQRGNYSGWFRSANTSESTYLLNGNGYYWRSWSDYAYELYAQPAIHLNLGTVAKNSVTSPTGTTTGITHVSTTPTDPTSTDTTTPTDPTTTGNTNTSGGSSGTGSTSTDTTTPTDPASSGNTNTSGGSTGGTGTTTPTDPASTGNTNTSSGSTGGTGSTSTDTTTPTNPSSTGNTNSSGNNTGNNSGSNSGNNSSGDTVSPENPIVAPVYETDVEPDKVDSSNGEDSKPIAIIVCAVAIPLSIMMFAIGLVRYIHYKKTMDELNNLR